MENKNMNTALFIAQEYHCFDKGQSKLFRSPEQLSLIAQDCINNGNQILISRNLSLGLAEFGIKLVPCQQVPAEALLNFNLLKDLELHIKPHSEVLKSYQSNINLDVLIIQDSVPQASEIIQLFTRLSETTIFSYLVAGPDRVEWILGSMDYYDLKIASKKIRSTFKNTKEYLFQKEEGKDILARLERLENALNENDESHLIIYK